MKCPECKGAGSFQIEVDDWEDCRPCRGTGRVKGPNDQIAAHTIEFNLTDLQDAAVDRAVERLLHDGNLSDSIKAEVKKALVPEMTAQIAEIVRETLEGEFQPTDTYGHARGEKTTLRAMIVEQARAFLKATGKRRYTSDPPSNVRELVKDLVTDQWKKELEPETDKAIAELKKSLQSRLTDKVNAAVAALLKDPARSVP